jgi:transcriptional regulator GlxA family with amidase domain
MTLALIEEDYGSRLALSVARELVMRLRPPGDNESSLDASQFQCGPIDRLADLPAWISAHLNENLSVDVLSDRTCLCPRHFSRLFRRFFNVTPAAFVEQIRLDEARRLLSHPRNRVENVARAVGFKNAVSFRRAFQRRHGVSPSSYQRHSPGGLSGFGSPRVVENRFARNVKKSSVSNVRRSPFSGRHSRDLPYRAHKSAA